MPSTGWFSGGFKRKTTCKKTPLKGAASNKINHNCKSIPKHKQKTETTTPTKKTQHNDPQSLPKNKPYLTDPSPPQFPSLGSSVGFQSLRPLRPLRQRRGSRCRRGGRRCWGGGGGGGGGGARTWGNQRDLVLLNNLLGFCRVLVIRWSLAILVLSDFVEF